MVSSDPQKATFIFGLDRLIAKPGDEVMVAGKNLSASVQVEADGKALDFAVHDANSGSFTLTSDTTEGTVRVVFKLADKTLAIFSLLNDDDSGETPTIMASPYLICSDVIYKDASGNLLRGERQCTATLAACTEDGQIHCVATEDAPSALKSGASAKILAGQTVAGVNGTAAARPAACSADGATDCVAIPEFPAVDRASFTASDIRSGISIAGVAGAITGAPASCSADGEIACLANASYTAAATSGAAAKILTGQTLAGVSGTGTGRPADCTTDGGTDCVAVPHFPAIDKLNTLQANASKIRSGLTILGIPGTLDNCSSDGGVGCVAVGPSYAAALVSGAATKIVSGQTLGGIGGSAPLRPADCTADGSISCVTVANFPAVNRSHLISKVGKIESSVSIAGISGTLPQCSTDGGTACVAVANFPAVDKISLASHAGKIRTGTTIATVAGSLPDCSTDGGTLCVAKSDFPAMDKSLAAPSILAGQSLGGVNGTAAGRPSDCSMDGGLGCVTVNSFPAMDAAAAAPKILSGQSIAGISGQAALRPADCSVDGDTGCVAIAAFPAIDKASLSTNTAKIRDSLSLAGVAGSLPDCSDDGEAGCVAIGPSYAAALLTGAATKIASGRTLAGVSGSAPTKPGDCATDGGTGCVATAGFPAANAATAPAKIVSGQSVAGIPGTASGIKPSDCSADAELGCVSVPGFPAMQHSGAAAKIAAGENLGGVAGTASARPSDCTVDGDTDCVAVTAFPAIHKSNLISHAGKIQSSLTLAGIAGTLQNCASDGGIDCVAVTSYPAARLIGAASKILTGQTVAGISGSGALKPADCSADGSVGCVTVNSYPSVDKAALAASANKIRSSLSIASVTGTLADCAVDGASGCVALANYPAADKAVAAAKIVLGQSVAGVNGTALSRPADCSADGATGCVAVTNYPAVDKSALTAAAGGIRSSLSFGNVTGSMLNCSTDGQASCYASGGFLAADTSSAAAKILSGQTLAGINGTAPARPADCAADGATACVAVANYPALDKNALTAAAHSVRSNLSIANVTGTLADCSADGQSSCYAVTAYPAALKAGAAAKILTGQTLAGVAGSGAGRPADCAADGSTGCVTVGNYPSLDKTALASQAGKIRSSLTIATVTGTLADCNSDNGTTCVTSGSYPSVVKANVTAGVLKSGTVVAGVTGAYPSASYPLAGADSTADLDTATFNAKIKSSSAFEWFDSTGNRYTGSGDADIESTKVKSGIDIFGSTGTFGGTCTADGQIDCMTTSIYKSVDMSALSAWDIRAGKNAGGLSGQLLFYKNTVGSFNRTSGTGALAGVDAYDTIDDYNNGGALPSSVPASWTMLPGSNWLRDSASDSNSNASCDGTEECVYKDQNTGLYWAKAPTGTRTWESSISYCENSSYGTYSNWRLPTQKELYQGYIDGLWHLDNVLNISNSDSYWTSTTKSNSTANAWRVDLYNGGVVNTGKTGATYTICVR